MLSASLILAFTLGLFSSFHCVGMCGAIAFSLPVNRLPGNKRLGGLLLYNLGRILTYSAIGLLFGLVGRQLFLAGIQQWFTIIAGIVMLVMVAWTIVVENSPIKWKPLARINGLVLHVVSRHIGSPSLKSTFVIGVANGFLPCGMVYFAVTGALASPSIAGSILFMTFFGLGTVPAMFAFSLFGMMANVKVRNIMKKSTPYVLSFMAVILILRGLNLGIPYLSPHFDNSMTETQSCH